MLEQFFDPTGLAPHGTCLLWRTDVFWSLVGADLAIAVAYVAISSFLLIFILKRKDVSLRGIGSLFAAFILFCAASHATDIWTMWIPEYGVQAVIKIVTATISLSTAVLLWVMLPKILALPSVKQMIEVNASLLSTKNSLRQAQQNLEAKVNERTHELQRTALELRNTISELAESNAQLESTRAELEGLILHDPLTGAWNRKKVQETAMQEMRRMARYGHPVSMVFIDLDHFKQVNDAHGHGVGDDILREFCAVSSQCMRSTDLLGRWGSEEFVILAPNSDLAIATALAERICVALTEYDFPIVGRLTASFGVAMYRREETWDAWLARADNALYEAKKAGRCCVIASGE